MSDPKVCGHCGGTGRVPLSERQLAALGVMGRSWWSVAELHEQVSLGGGITAMNNAVAELYLLGFVERTRVGRSYEYRRVQR